jgi:hypothetical protein
MNTFHGRLVGSVLVLAAVVGGCAGSSITLTRSQSELQESIAKRFPITKERYLAAITFRDPKVLLRNGDDRIGLDVETEIRFPFAAPIVGRVATLGRLYYDPDAKAFYFRDASIERLDFRGLEGDLNFKVRAALEAVGKPTLESIPVYKLEGRNLKETTAQHFLTEVFVRGGKLYLKLGRPE